MAELLPWIKSRWLDANGEPLAGGKINTYVAGTSTRKATYVDEAETTANANPVILDSDGYADIYISGGAYKFVVTDADDNLIYSIDNITRPSTGPAGSSFLVGNGTPASSLGTDGDYYLDASTGIIYSKATGSWVATSSNIFAGGTQQTLVGGGETISGLIVSSASFIKFKFEYTVLRGSNRQSGWIEYLFTGGSWQKADEYLVNSQSVTFSIHATTGQVSVNGTAGDKLITKILSKTPVET